MKSRYSVGKGLYNDFNDFHQLYLNPNSTFIPSHHEINVNNDYKEYNKIYEYINDLPLLNKEYIKPKGKGFKVNKNLMILDDSR